MYALWSALTSVLVVGVGEVRIHQDSGTVSTDQLEGESRERVGERRENVSLESLSSGREGQSAFFISSTHFPTLERVLRQVGILLLPSCQTMRKDFTPNPSLKTTQNFEIKKRVFSCTLWKTHQELSEWRESLPLSWIGCVFSLFRKIRLIW